MQSFKNIIIVIFLFFSYNFSALANEKIVFIDIDFLLKKSNLGKSISDSLNKLNNDNNKKIKSYEKKLIDEENGIKKVQNILSQEELKTKVSIFKENIKKFNEEKKNTSIEFNNRKNTKLKNFFDKINPLISDYMEKKSINIIIEKKNIFIGKNTHDITNEILEIINSKFN